MILNFYFLECLKSLIEGKTTCKWAFLCNYINVNTLDINLQISCET